MGSFIILQSTQKTAESINKKLGEAISIGSEKATKIKENKTFNAILRYSLRIFLILGMFCLSSDAFAGCGDNANPALKTLCDIMRLLHGRLGRAFVMVTLTMSGFQFSQGGLQWQPLVTLFIGIGMFWAPKTVALFILPQYITGVQGEGYTPDQILSPDEILSCACPDLY
jgi:type IV secretory pathway VirB2 component (pilin)